jgi:hypothetical protein
VIEERSADRSDEASWKEESAEKGEENATGKSYRDAAIVGTWASMSALHLDRDHLNAYARSVGPWTTQ